MKEVLRSAPGIGIGDSTTNFSMDITSPLLKESIQLVQPSLFAVISGQVSLARYEREELGCIRMLTYLLPTIFQKRGRWVAGGWAGRWVGCWGSGGCVRR